MRRTMSLLRLFLFLFFQIMIEYGGSVYRTENESAKSPLVEATATPEEQRVQVPCFQPTLAESDELVRMVSAIVTSTAIVTSVMVGLLVQPTLAESDKHDRMEYEGVTSIVMGLLVVGPFFGLLLGVVTAYAFDKVGVAGDAARAVGDVAFFAKK